MPSVALIGIGAFGGGARGAAISSVLWTDNGDGTATVTFATDVATYAGVDYGTSAGAYTASSFNYDGAGPALELATSHTVEIPDPIAGGTEADDTYYFRVWTQTSGGVTSYGTEATGDITSGPGGATNVITLENDTDSLLMETGDYLLVESGGDAAFGDFAAASSLADADVIVGVQSGTTKKFALSDLKAYING